MKILVVPTIRQHNIVAFLEAWKKAENWDKIIIVEDNPEKGFELNVDYHYSWKEIDDDLKDKSWVISRKDSAIRSYGFLKAYELGADFIFTLDDDCFPFSENFIENHLNNLLNFPKWGGSIPNVKTRGMPYRNYGKLNNVVMNLGLWEGIPDFDAIQMLSNNEKKLVLPKSRILPINQYYPICGMNLSFKREITPACYFPLMGQNSKYGRFDDIWFGIICKKICDHLNLLISCGEPYIFHSKASCEFNNLVKEAPGVVFNEVFWEYIDKIELKQKTVLDCLLEVSESLENCEEIINSKADITYLNELGKCLKIWCSFF